jgi:hypothetical protein
MPCAALQLASALSMNLAWAALWWASPWAQVLMADACRARPYEKDSAQGLHRREGGESVSGFKRVQFCGRVAEQKDRAQGLPGAAGGAGELGAVGLVVGELLG